MNRGFSTENSQENERKVNKDKSLINCLKCKKMGHYANECKSQKDSSVGEKLVTFAMMWYEDEKYEKGEEENKEESKNPDDEERKVDPGTARNTVEPQGIQHLQLCIREEFMTGIMNDWAMSTIEDNLADLRDQDQKVQVWRES